MKTATWSRRSHHVCRTYQAEHRVAYLVTTNREVYRREYQDNGARWFRVGAVGTLKEAKLLAVQDLDLWLAGNSSAERCEAPSLKI